MSPPAATSGLGVGFALLLSLMAASGVAVEPVAGGSYRASVLWVMDGDSLRARIDGQDYDLRLWGIDAPERDQAGAEASRAALRALVDKRTLRAEVVTVDEYQRLVVRLFQAQREVNLAQIAHGHAWWFARFARHADAFRRAQEQARASRLGLWRQVEPEPPWTFRDRHRED